MPISDCMPYPDSQLESRLMKKMQTWHNVSCYIRTVTENDRFCEKDFFKNLCLCKVLTLNAFLNIFSHPVGDCKNDTFFIIFVIKTYFWHFDKCIKADIYIYIYIKFVWIFQYHLITQYHQLLYVILVFFSQDAGLYCQYLGAASVSSVYKILQNV